MAYKAAASIAINIAVRFLSLGMKIPVYRCKITQNPITPLIQGL